MSTIYTRKFIYLFCFFPDEPPSKKSKTCKEIYVLNELDNESLMQLFKEIDREIDEEEFSEEEGVLADLDVVETGIPSDSGTIIINVPPVFEGVERTIDSETVSPVRIDTLSPPTPSPPSHSTQQSTSSPPHSIPFTWVPSPPDLSPIEFSGHSRLKQFPAGNQPIDFFNLIFQDNFYDLIIRETNKFAEEIFLRPHSHRSRITEWRDLSKEELKKFIGLVFHMGIVKLNRVTEYWNTNEKFNLKFFSCRMSRDRFLGIRQAFHLASNSDDPTPQDPLNKILPLLEYFHETMERVCDPGKNICIDESMAPWRGRISFRQYLPLKRHKYGIKLYMLAERDGLSHRFLVYTGARDKDLAGAGHVTKVVHKLMTGLKFCGRSLFTDNYYNSVDLTRELLSQDTYVTGTLRGSRKNNPREVVDARLRKGEKIERWSHDGINVCKWKDKREVLTISSEFSGKMVKAPGRHGQEVEKPEVVRRYNENMGGVDRLDQHLSYYSSEHKTIKWYVKLSFHIIEIMLSNSYALYRRYSGERSMDLYTFRLSIIDALCGTVEKTPTLPKSPRYFNYQHVSEYLPYIPSGKRRQQKSCRTCKKDKVSTICPGCEGMPGLCIGECFRAYHKKMGYISS